MKIFVIAFLLFFVNLGYTKPLTYYSFCDKGPAFCSRCVPSSDRVDFLIDKAAGRVTQKVFVDDRAARLTEFRDCRVVDDLNWDCSYDKSLKDVVYKRTLRMKGGRFVDQMKLHVPPDYTTFDNSCAN